MKQNALPRMFDQDTIIVMGAEWELCRIEQDGLQGHCLKLKFGDEMIVVGLSNIDKSPKDKEREEIAKFIVFAAAQLAEKGMKKK